MLIIMAACSTAPKETGDVYRLRKQAEAQIEIGNRETDRGGYNAALTMLDEAMRLAVITDDPGLRIRAGLSRGNVLFAMGRSGEAAECWNHALSEAERAKMSELAAVCRIYIARGTLLSPDGKVHAQSVRDEVERNMAFIKSDRLYTAFAWIIAGLAEKELNRYAQAEAAIRRSLEIHEKEHHLELAAYDWFLIASFRSLAADYPGARQALEMAMAFDRRVENSWGLASDWRALGDVCRKAGDHDASRAAYLRAAGIYHAIGDTQAAEETLSRAESR